MIVYLNDVIFKEGFSGVQEIETVNLEYILYTFLTNGQYFFLLNFDPIHTNPRSESNCSFSPGTW